MKLDIAPSEGTLEIVRLTKRADGLYEESKDAAGQAAPAENINKDFTPDIEGQAGDLFLLKVIES